MLDFTLLQNTGAAFSILAGASGWQRWFFIGLARGRERRADGLAVAASARQSACSRSRLSLVLGGALGNVIDRVMHGYVVDFIYFHWRGCVLSRVQRRRHRDHRSVPALC